MVSIAFYTLYLGGREEYRRLAVKDVNPQGRISIDRLSHHMLINTG